MKHVFQFGFLCAVYYTGDLIANLARLPVPGSVIGMLLLLVLLRTGLVKSAQVEDVADFLIRVMPILFVPIIAGLMVSYRLLAGDLGSFLVVMAVSTVLVFAATGLTAQAIIRHRRRSSAVPAVPPPPGEESSWEDDA